MHLNRNSFSIEAVLLFLGSALILALLIRLTQVWEAVVILGTAAVVFWHRYQVSVAGKEGEKYAAAVSLANLQGESKTSHWTDEGAPDFG